ncbi:MAG: IS3 family transposase [Patescibacteria group bacterium]
MKEGKKIAIVKISNNKKLIAGCMNINHKNIYHKSKMQVSDLEVKEKIEENHITNPAYGHRRLALDLKMNKKKILRVMHEFNLKPPRLWYQKKYITQASPDYQDQYTNLLKDVDLNQYTIGDVWSSDLTYIKYQGKFIYLAIIQDIVSKEIVGFNLSNHHDSDLVLKTVKEALLKTKKPPLIFHSDRGREYLSENCITFLESLKVKISVSDPGAPWQNSWSESFFSRFKTESGDFNRFETPGELLEYIFSYLSYYNNDRIQVKLKMSPVQFKLNFVESVLEKRGT